MISELEIRHLSFINSSCKSMTLTLQHPKALRTAFLWGIKLDGLKNI